jgi:hypothetical protein
MVFLLGFKGEVWEFDDYFMLFFAVEFLRGKG